MTTLLAGAACGGGASGPTSPDVPQAQFGGAWQGEYRVTTCTGGRHCVLTIGSDRPYVLSLSQSGADVVGVFTSDGAVVDVLGRVAADGQLALTAAPPAVPTDLSSFTRFAARLTVDGEELHGTIEFTIGAPFFGSLPATAYTRGGDLRTSVRGALTPVSSYAGLWQGEYIVRACTPSGWPECHWAQPGARYWLELRLSQSADAVTGSLILSSSSTTVPVQGTISGDALTLTGELVAEISGGSQSTRLVSWTGRRDAVGRLAGTFHVVDETSGLSPAPMSMTYDAELLGVVSIP